jgi:hypothetical protein
MSLRAHQKLPGKFWTCSAAHLSPTQPSSFCSRKESHQGGFDIPFKRVVVELHLHGDCNLISKNHLDELLENVKKQKYFGELLKIATWNSQGNPTRNEVTTKTLQWLLDNCSVIFLQECGALEASDLPQGCYFSWVEHLGAKNRRCRTGLISNMQLQDIKYESLLSSSGRMWLAGIYDMKYVVATLHAEASGVAGIDTDGAVKDLLKNYGEKAPLVIGADFNRDPFEVSNSRTRSAHFGTASRGVDFDVVSVGKATHEHGATLDYFLTRNVGCVGTARYPTRGGSDHYPIYSEFRLK